ncbi:MAG: hypothetical protein ACXABY_12650 [Candidatus Thorarchaeota archaeon]|jgi:hypothetical protein
MLRRKSRAPKTTAAVPCSTMKLRVIGGPTDFPKEIIVEMPFIDEVRTNSIDIKWIKRLMFGVAGIDIATVVAILYTFSQLIGG